MITTLATLAMEVTKGVVARGGDLSMSREVRITNCLSLHGKRRHNTISCAMLAFLDEVALKLGIPRLLQSQLDSSCHLTVNVSMNCAVTQFKFRWTRDDG